MTEKHWSNELPQSACRDALEWAREQDSASSAWRDCQRGDWMLWLLGKWCGPPDSPSRKKLVLAACACARLALPHVKAGESRLLKAIETAEQWARSENTVKLQDVRIAAADADAAADDAAYAAHANARIKTLARCANVVREHYPTPPERP